MSQRNLGHAATDEPLQQQVQATWLAEHGIQGVHPSLLLPGPIALTPYQQPAARRLRDIDRDINEADRVVALQQDGLGVVLHEAGHEERVLGIVPAGEAVLCGGARARRPVASQLGIGPGATFARLAQRIVAPATHSHDHVCIGMSEHRLDKRCLARPRRAADMDQCPLPHRPNSPMRARGKSGTPRFASHVRFRREIVCRHPADDMSAPHTNDGNPPVRRDDSADASLKAVRSR